MVVVGLVGGAVVVTAVVLARRTPSAPLAGQPDWAPLTLVGPDVLSSTDGPATLGAPTAREPDVPAPTPLRVVETPAMQSPAVQGSAGSDRWIASDAHGGCPQSHPVKTARSSRVYHLPGGHFYERTRAERCYCDEAAAEADGFRAAKR
jgi:hypothetical protein